MAGVGGVGRRGWWARRRGPRRGPRRRAFTPAERQHYHTHKEAARTLVHDRLAYWNTRYGYTYHRVAIKNTRSRWGSCSSRGNLNFNYRIVFLPPPLQDYLIVHELCHLEEMNHKPQFWALVARELPDYQKRIQLLKEIEPKVLSML